MEGAKYLLDKIPLNNMFLKMVSSVDPECDGSTAAERMRKLQNFFLNFVHLVE